MDQKKSDFKRCTTTRQIRHFNQQAKLDDHFQDSRGGEINKKNPAEHNYATKTYQKLQKSQKFNLPATIQIRETKVFKGLLS